MWFSYQFYPIVAFSGLDLRWCHTQEFGHTQESRECNPCNERGGSTSYAPLSLSSPVCTAPICIHTEASVHPKDLQCIQVLCSGTRCTARISIMSQPPHPPQRMGSLDLSKHPARKVGWTWKANSRCLIKNLF